MADAAEGISEMVGGVQVFLAMESKAIGDRAKPAGAGIKKMRLARPVSAMDGTNSHHS